MNSGRVIRFGPERCEPLFSPFFCNKPAHSVPQFRARNWGGSQGQISRARLAVQIAKRIAEFITVRLLSIRGSQMLIRLSQSMEGVQCTEAGWKVGKDGIQIDHLVLYSVSCVSRGSWQPLLRIRP